MIGAKRNLDRGFGLVELVIVVGVVSLLAYLAATRVRVYKINAARAEAKTMLKSIDTALASYTLSYQNEILSSAPIGVPLVTYTLGRWGVTENCPAAVWSFGTLEEFDFPIEDVSCQGLRFNYTVSVFRDPAAGNSIFHSVQAQSGYVVGLEYGNPVFPYSNCANPLCYDLYVKDGDDDIRMSDSALQSM